MPRLKAVSFDLDGTLLDSTEAIVASFMHTFSALGEAAPPRQRLVNTIGHTLEQQFRMFTDRDPHECAAVYRDHYGRAAAENTKLLPGAETSLERLADEGFKLGFATSKRLKYSEMLLEHFGILHYFASRIGPDEVTHPKPHPEAVLKSCADLGVAPGELVFVGDTRFDVLAAQAAGVRCLAVTTGYASRDELRALQPEALFDRLDAVTAYLLDGGG
jgi:phosphoglycolate phosphatase